MSRTAASPDSRPVRLRDGRTSQLNSSERTDHGIQGAAGDFNAGELERDLNGHAAQGWRVAGTFQAISWMKSRTPTVSVLERARA
jgi:hypothetical protein